MLSTTVLAHGGTAGGVIEGAFLVVPLVVFAVLAWRSHRSDKDAREPNQPGGKP